jgi:hypothetical protein
LGKAEKLIGRVGIPYVNVLEDGFQPRLGQFSRGLTDCCGVGAAQDAAVSVGL